MRLSLNETGFLFSTALRASGLPYGAVNAAVRMVQWAETFHGNGVTFLERRRRGPLPPIDRARVVVTAETEAGARIDGAGQTTLLVGPGALDLATAKARATGIGIVTGTNVRDLLWLGQLAQRGAGRGLVCAVSFQAAVDAPEAAELTARYSLGRSVIALPAEPAPLWIEMAQAPASHERLMQALADAPWPDWPSDVLAPSESIAPGFTILCLAPEPDGLVALGTSLRAAAATAGASVLEPEDVAALQRRAIEQGFEVDEAEYYPLARFGLTTVIPATDTSRAQAGADS